MIVSPSGVVISDIIKDNNEGIVYAECDISEIVTQKSIHDIAGSYQRSDVFKFEIDKSILKPVNIKNNELNSQEDEYYPFTLEEKINE